MWFVVFFLKTYTTRVCLRSTFDIIIKYDRLLYIAPCNINSEFITVHKIASISSVDESSKATVADPKNMNLKAKNKSNTKYR